MAVRKGRYLALLMIALVTAVCLRLAVLLALVTLAAVLARLTLATLLLLAAALVVLMAALLALVGVVLGLALLIRVLAVAALTALLTVGLVLVVLIVGVVGHDASPCAGDRCNVADGSSFLHIAVQFGAPSQRSTCASLSREGSDGLALRLMLGFALREDF
jgi:hypothetical protein